MNTTDLFLNNLTKFQKIQKKCIFWRKIWYNYIEMEEKYMKLLKIVDNNFK